MWTDRVELNTIHSFKGREATSVVLVASENDFPLGHPAWFLTRIFGTTLNQSTAEERRILYVGASRAASDLYLFVPTGVRITSMVVETGAVLDLLALQAAGPQRAAWATSSVWPASGGVARLESLGYTKTNGAHRWTLRGSVDRLDVAAHDALIGWAGARVEIRGHDGTILHERGLPEREALSAIALATVRSF
jgi:hypothetical protein